MKAGYLYIIVNRAWPEWTKIGITDNLNKRLNSYQTSSPFRDYELIYSIHHPDYLKAEKKLKETMKPFATEIKGEWYKCDKNFVKSRLDEILEHYDEYKDK